MWAGFIAIRRVRKDDMTLPEGAPGHLQPEDGPVETPPAKCAGMIIKAGKKFLLIKRVENGVWEQPGGHLDPGETPLQAAHREAHEEIGMKPSGTAKQVKHTIGNGVDYTTFLKEVPTPFTPTLSHEHTAFGWHGADELPANTHPKCAETIKEIAKGS
jgi:8-oxo-dGTP pyrophosphatase MutT (NUDIX family)